jgi:superfamily II DNA or RNA helicase
MDLSEIQLKAIVHIKNSFSRDINPICALDMGLGKTRVACSVIQEFIEQNNQKILIVHKASNYEDPWLKELSANKIIKYDPVMQRKEDRIEYPNQFYIHGKYRRANIKNNKYNFTTNILLTSYDTLKKDLSDGLYDLSCIFDLIIFDEIHTIANHKKLTQRSRQLISLPAKYKLGLTGTPIQNDPKELGLIYIFLNDPAKFIRVMKLDERIMSINSKNDKPKRNDITSEKDQILQSGLDECAAKIALFFQFEQKGDFVKSEIILSLPINAELYSFMTENLKKAFQKMMYLSHPASIYFQNKRDQQFPACAKADAVKMILENMLDDEKAIIFSQYKEVLNVYFDLCLQCGFPAIIITGDDKGKRLKKKLELFRYSSQSRVLLTTIQKSSEGFNFDFATHIIVLEFWWNPQKIFQAMSRIDRKAQRRNIFIYLLCYNRDGAILMEEACFYEKMEKKINEAQEIFQIISEKGNFENMKNKIVTKELPKIEWFLDEQSLKFQLTDFLSSFHKTSELPRNQVDEKLGFPIYETRMAIRTQFRDHVQFWQSLFQNPWRIIYDNYSNYLSSFFMQRLNGRMRNKLIEKIRDKNKPFSDQQKIVEYYPFVFTQSFSSYRNNIKRRFQYIIGKKKNGSFDVLHIGEKYTCYGNLLSILQDIGIKKIDTFILSEKVPNNFIETRTELEGFFHGIDIQWTTTGFLGKMKLLGVKQQEIGQIEPIFFSRSKSEASDLCERWSEWIYLKHIPPRAKFFLDSISYIYRYYPEDRMIIASTNVINYIHEIVQILMNSNELYGIFGQVIATSTIIAQVVLENGADLIPFWEYLTKPIYPK